MVSSFNLLIQDILQVYYMNWFLNVKPTLHFLLNPTWSQYINFLLDFFISILLRIFHLYPYDLLGV